jgi:hypothetical protein
MPQEDISGDQVLELKSIEPEWFINSCYDISIPCGWFELALAILNKAKNLGFEKDQLKVLQIKEKCQEMRFYIRIKNYEIDTDMSNNYLNDFISKAENESSHICAKCGGNKNIHEDAIIKTICLCKSTNLT